MSSHTPSPLEATLASLKHIITQAAGLRTTADGLRAQLEAVVKQERERLNPTALEMAGRKLGYSVNLITPDRKASEGSLWVLAGDVIFLHKRLWITDQYGATRVLEATDNPVCWNAISAKLPELDHARRPKETIAGAEVRTVLPTRCVVDGGGQRYHKRVDVDPSSRQVFHGKMRYSAIGSDKPNVELREPQLDTYHGETYYNAAQYLDTIKVLFQVNARAGHLVTEAVVAVRRCDIDHPEGPGGTSRVNYAGFLYELSAGPNSDGHYVATRVGTSWRERQGLADWRRFKKEREARAAAPSPEAVPDWGEERESDEEGEGARAVYRTIYGPGVVVDEMGPLGDVMCDDDPDNTETVEYKGKVYTVDQTADRDYGMVLAVRYA
jgi:hypothetical protein